MSGGGAIKKLQRAVRARLLMAATLGSPHPIFPSFGWSDGTPVDRYYIEDFLARNAASVRGRVLEIGDRAYTERFGGGRVTCSDVLSAEPGEDGVIVGDLAEIPEITDGTYDCVILVQTLHYVFDMASAVSELHRILAPGGAALVTVPGVSQVSAWDMARWGDRWRLTDLALRELLETRFAADDVEVGTRGNAAAAVAFLQGIPAERLAQRVLDAVNAEYPIVVTARATKAVS